MWCYDTISRLGLRTCTLLFDIVNSCKSLGKDHQTLTPRWRFVRLLDYHHSFTNLLPLGSLQSEGYRLTGFCRCNAGPFPLHALDGGLKVISVGIRTHPKRDGSLSGKKQTKWKELHDGIPNLDASTAHNTIHNRSNERHRPDLGDGILKVPVRTGLQSYGEEPDLEWLVHRVLGLVVIARRKQI